MLQRLLDEDEARSLGQPNTLAIKFRSAAIVDPTNLERAVQILFDNNPVLRAIIKGEDGNHTLSADSDINAELIRIRGGIPELKSLHTNSYDPSERLVRFYFCVISEKEAAVGIRADHAVADAHFLGGVLFTLLQVYSDLILGLEPKLKYYNSLPKSPHEILQEHGGTIVSPLEINDAKITELGQKFERSERSTSRYSSATLNHTDTSSIIDLSRRLDTSVTALMSSALMLTIRNRDRRPGLLPVAYSSAIDLRNWVRPKLKPLEASNSMFNHMSEFNLPKTFNIPELGRRIKGHVQDSITSLKLFSPWPSVRHLTELSCIGINSLSVSCPGIFKAPDLLNGLELGNVFSPGIHFPECGNYYEADASEIEDQRTALYVFSAWWTSDKKLFMFCYSSGPESSNYSLIKDSVNSLLEMADKH